MPTFQEEYDAIAKKQGLLPFSEITSSFPELKELNKEAVSIAPPQPSLVPSPVPKQSNWSAIPEALGRGAAEGLFGDLPGMVGRAIKNPAMVAENIGGTLSKVGLPMGNILQGVAKVLPSLPVIGGKVGTALTNWEEYYNKQSNELFGSPEEYGTAANVVYKGTKMIPPALIATRLGGPALTGTLFGLSAMEQATEDAKKMGVDPGLAPLLQGLIQGVGGMLGGKYLGEMAGIPNSVVKMTLPIFLKDLGANTLNQVLVTYGSAQVDKQSGIRPDADPLGEAISVIGPTVFSMGLTGAIGTLRQRGNEKKTNNLFEKALNSGDIQGAQDLRNYLQEKGRDVKDWDTKLVTTYKDLFDLSLNKDHNLSEQIINAVKQNGYDVSQWKDILSQLKDQPQVLPKVPEGLSSQPISILPNPEVVKKSAQEVFTEIPKKIEPLGIDNPISTLKAINTPGILRTAEEKLLLKEIDKKQEATEVPLTFQKKESPIVTPFEKMTEIEKNAQLKKQNDYKLWEQQERGKQNAQFLAEEMRKAEQKQPSKENKVSFKTQEIPESPIDRIKFINEQAGVNPVTNDPLIKIIKPEEYGDIDSAWIPINGNEGVRVADSNSKTTHAALAKLMGFTGDETQDVNGDALKSGWIRKSSPENYEVYELTPEIKDKLIELIKNSYSPEKINSITIDQFMGGKQLRFDVNRIGDITSNLNKIKFATSEVVKEPEFNNPTLLQKVNDIYKKSGITETSETGQEVPTTFSGESQQTGWQHAIDNLTNPLTEGNWGWNRWLRKGDVEAKDVAQESLPKFFNQAKNVIESGDKILINRLISHPSFSSEIDTAFKAAKDLGIETNLKPEDFRFRVFNDPSETISNQLKTSEHNKLVDAVVKGAQGLADKDNAVLDWRFVNKITKEDVGNDADIKSAMDANGVNYKEVGNPTSLDHIVGVAKLDGKTKKVVGLSYQYIKGKDVFDVVRIATSNQPISEITHTTFHEFLHLIRDHGGITQKELDAFQNHYSKNKEGIDFFEVATDMFGKTVIPESQIKSPWGKVLLKVRGFVDNLKSFVNGQGWKTPQDAFRRIWNDNIKQYYENQEARYKEVEEFTKKTGIKPISSLDMMGADPEYRFKTTTIQEEKPDRLDWTKVQIDLGVIESTLEVKPGELTRMFIKNAIKSEPTPSGDREMTQWMKATMPIVWAKEYFKNPAMTQAYDSASSASDLMHSSLHNFSENMLPIMKYNPKDKGQLGRLSRAIEHSDKLNQRIPDDILKSKYGLDQESIAIYNQNAEGSTTALRTVLDFLEKQYIESYNISPNRNWIESFDKMYNIWKNDSISPEEKSKQISDMTIELKKRLTDSENKKFDEVFKTFGAILAKNDKLLQSAKDGFYAPRFRSNGKYIVRVFDSNHLDEQGNPKEVWLERTDSASFGAIEKTQRDKIIAKLNKKFSEPNYKVQLEQVEALPEGMYDNIGSRAMAEYTKAIGEKLQGNENVSEEALQEVMNKINTLIADDLASRSIAKSRFIGRKGSEVSLEELDVATPEVVGGYNTNFKEAWFNWASSMSSMISRVQFTNDMTKTMKTVDPKTDKVMWEYLKQFQEDMSAPKSKYMSLAGKYNSFVAVSFLAGMARVGIINPTQMLTTGSVELASDILGKRVSPLSPKWIAANGKALAMLTKASKDLFTDKLTPDERHWLEEGFMRGTTQAQAIRMMRDQATMGFGASFKQFLDKSMLPISWTEEKSRQVLLLSGMRSGMSRGLSPQDAFNSAKNIVDKSLYNYEKYNDPAFVRQNAVFKGMYALRRFQHNYMSWMMDSLRNSPDGKIHTEKLITSYLWYGILGGLAGVPFADDVLELLEKVTGTPWRAKISKMFGFGNKYLERGIQAGLPSAINAIDISGSLKMSGPTPKDLSAQGIIGGLAEFLAGPGLGLLTKGFNTAKYVGLGDYTRAAESAAPSAISELIKGFRMGTEGITNSQGKPILDLNGKPMKLNTLRAMLQGIGLKSPEVGEVQRYERYGKLVEANMRERRSRLTYKLRQYVDNGKGDINDIREDINSYNKKASEYRGKIPLYTAETFRSSREQKAGGVNTEIYKQ